MVMIDHLHTHCLGNGLQIVGEVMPDFESIAVSYTIRTGARDEHNPTLAGISHFLEHMVFKGTATLDWQQLKQAFTRIGAEKNGSTSVERTLYYLRVQSDYLDRAVELLSDMMFPRLAESDFHMEKEVIINEIARSEDQPYSFIRRRMMQAYFGVHPLGNYVLGSRESIHNMSLEQMRDYWQHHYVANNSILSIAGKFDWDHLIELVERYCNTWRMGEAERLVTAYEPAQPGKTIMVDQKLKQQIMLITMPMIDMRDPDYYAAILGSDILGDPNGSRLYWNIRQRGLAQTAQSTIWAMEGTGILFIRIHTTPENAPQILNQAQAELKRLLTDGIREDELQRAKDKWMSRLVLSGESTYSRMYALTNDWIRDARLTSIDEKINAIEKVTREDVMRTLHRFPLLSKQVLTTLGPLNEEQLGIL